jgi:HTH-type transcriptional regulator, quorum sensing regulator NprR
VHIGRRIMKLRKNLGVSQTEFAKGIVSPSHLSNIESGRYIPAEDILKAISTKLSVPPDYLINHDKDDKILDSLLKKFHENLLHEFDIKSAEHIYNEIIKENTYIPSVHQEAYYLLCKCCYLVKRNEGELAKEIFDKEFEPLLNEVSIDAVPPSFRTLFLYYMGHASFSSFAYNDSYQYYSELLILVNNDSIKAYILYNISIVLYKMDNITEAIARAKQALNLFLHENMWYEIGDIYNLLSVLYLENNDFQKCKESLSKAQKLAETQEIPNLKEKIFHNFGLFYKKKKEYELSLKYFYHSLDIKRKNGSNKISLTYRPIINIYIELGKIKKALQVLNEAKTYSDDEMDTYMYYLSEGRIYFKLGKYEKYEEAFKKAISYFYQKRLWRILKGLPEEIADYYLELRKYKEATKYLKLELEINNRVKEMQS